MKICFSFDQTDVDVGAEVDILTRQVLGNDHALCGLPTLSRSPSSQRPGPLIDVHFHYHLK